MNKINSYRVFNCILYIINYYNLEKTVWEVETRRIFLSLATQNPENAMVYRLYDY